jgi:hypothetical protein
MVIRKKSGLGADYNKAALRSYVRFVTGRKLEMAVDAPYLAVFS